MQPNLVELMKESKGIIDLEKRLNDRGIRFDNYREYFNWLCNEWYKVAAPQLQKIVDSQTDDSLFPTLIVKQDDTEYHLHGIVHGGFPSVTPCLQPREEVRKWISEVLSSFHNPSQREDYLYEENLWVHFDLLKSRELKDITATIRHPNPSLENLCKIMLVIPMGIVACLALPVITSYKYLDVKRKRNKKRTLSEEMEHLLIKALEDKRYQNKNAEFIGVQKLPEPFNLEISYLQAKNSRWKSFYDSIAMGPASSTVPERSLWTSKILRDHASKRRIRILHYLGGCYHVSEIAYFLKNPDCAFEKLEEYARKRK